MPKLVLVRHGQSVFNQEGRHTGQTDAPLTEMGRAQSVEAGQILACDGVHPDVVFYSPLVRAVETASLILETMKVAPKNGRWAVPELMEKSDGCLEGLKWEEGIAQYGEDTVRHWKRTIHGAPPGGESPADVYHRVIKWWCGVMGKVNTDAMVVAHEYPIRAIKMFYEGIPVERMFDLKIPNAQPIIIQV
jgi:2,3-bisphosphoglycerate-dependent phosphoglycerate mutase